MEAPPLSERPPTPNADFGSGPIPAQLATSASGDPVVYQQKFLAGHTGKITCVEISHNGLVLATSQKVGRVGIEHFPLCDLEAFVF